MDIVKAQKLTDSQMESLADSFERGLNHRLHFDPNATNLIWSEESKKFILVDSGNSPSVPVQTQTESTLAWLKRWQDHAFTFNSGEFERFKMHLQARQIVE